MDKDKAAFVIYIINEIANRKKIYPSYVYRILNKTECIKQYLVPYYDVLHTMSSESIVNDVFEYVRLRGVSL